MLIVTLVCGTCGASFERKQKEVRRQFQQGHNRCFCSRSCAAKANRYRGPGNLGNLVSSNKRDGYTGFRRFLRKARSRDAETNLTLGYLKDVWVCQGQTCPYTGIRLTLASGKNADPITQASLDRIDSSVGYRIGNVQFVALPINYAKNNYTDAQVRKFLDIVRSA